MKQHNLFVYGSLKRGFHNHFMMNGLYTGEPQTATLVGATMYSLGAYPAIVLTHDTEQTVSGELYTVDELGLKELDRFEGHPNYYRRQLVMVMDGNGARHNAWVYEHAHPNELSDRTLINDGDWKGAN